jgi:hypothetical protein
METLEHIDMIGLPLWEVRKHWDYEMGTVPVISESGRFTGGEWPGERTPNDHLAPVAIRGGELVYCEFEECDAVQLV